MEYLTEFGKLQGLLKLPEIPLVLHTPDPFQQIWENWGGKCDCVWPMCQWTKHDAHNGDTPAFCLKALCGYEYKWWPYFEHDNCSGLHRGRQLYYEAAAVIQVNNLE